MQQTGKKSAPATEKAEAELERLRSENALLRQKVARLNDLVVRDTLTPLYNRRHFMDVLERWSWRAHRYGGECGIIFIDVDDLKSVNDAHGHSAGDKLLIAIANVLQRNVRRSDVAARIGGDEFAILLDSLDSDRILHTAERLRAEVAGLRQKIGGAIIQPSISVGNAMVEAGKSAEEILLQADRAMYAQKRGGKSDIAG